MQSGAIFLGKRRGLRRVKGMIPLTIPRIFGAEAAPKIGVGGRVLLSFLVLSLFLIHAKQGFSPPFTHRQRPQKILPIHTDESRQG
jgi:hypothetical protein